MMAGFSSERQLVLISAGIATRRRAMSQQAARLASDLDWCRLERTLRARRLLTNLGPRIIELANGAASTDFRAAVEHGIEVARRQGAFLQLVCQQITDELAKAGIASAPLKGPAMGEAIYDDPGRRISYDIDLLVAPAHLDLAVQVVRGLGYDAPTDPVEHHGLPLLHYALIHSQAKLPPIELHWRIHWYDRVFAHERLLPPSAEQHERWRPTAADELAALLLFYARDGFVGLRLATDLSAWWDTRAPELKPGDFDHLLDLYPALAPALSAAISVAEKVIGLPADQVLHKRPALGVRGHIATRLADPNPRASEQQLHADMGLVDGLLMPPGNLGGFVKRQILLSDEAFSERARQVPDWKAKSALGHAWRVLARYILATMQIVRGPERLASASSRQAR